MGKCLADRPWERLSSVPWSVPVKVDSCWHGVIGWIKLRLKVVEGCGLSTKWHRHGLVQDHLAAPRDEVLVGKGGPFQEVLDEILSLPEVTIVTGLVPRGVFSDYSQMERPRWEG